MNKPQSNSTHFPWQLVYVRRQSIEFWHAIEMWRWCQNEFRCHVNFLRQKVTARQRQHKNRNRHLEFYQRICVCQHENYGRSPFSSRWILCACVHETMWQKAHVRSHPRAIILYVYWPAPAQRVLLEMRQRQRARHEIERTSDNNNRLHILHEPKAKPMPLAARIHKPST